MSFISLALEVLITQLYVYFNNWGWAILGLALVVRALLFPIQLFTFKQQRLMARIQPQLEGVMKQYKEDPIKLYREMGVIKKREGVKGGLIFLATLIQIPLFMSIYKTFSSLQFLMGGSFAWLVTLGTPDPLYIFPAVVALTSYLQQRVVPVTGAKGTPQMNLMMKFMPVLSLAFMIMMPSGLVLYYAVSGCLQLGGDLILRRWGNLIT